MPEGKALPEYCPTLPKGVASVCCRKGVRKVPVID